MADRDGLWQSLYLPSAGARVGRAKSANESEQSLPFICATPAPGSAKVPEHGDAGRRPEPGSGNA